jgi:predicted aminopeptidase
MRAIALVICVLLASACETLEFYRQATVGQWSLMSRRQPTAKLIASPATDPALRARLMLVSQILEFAHDDLALEPGKRYSSFVRVAGDAVVWNVFATEEFSTHALRWCYPIVGCATYRGYFDRADAKRYAQRLIVRQHDAIVGGVAAYSTLGWFDDPLLSTFIDWSDPELAGLLFHELAHARVFVAGDTAFNEAFASFVERQGALQWLQSRGDRAGMDTALSQWRATDRFVAYLLEWRDEFEHLYEQPYNSVAHRLLKSALFAEMERCYRVHREVLGDQEAFFRSMPNNARLVPLAAYNEFVPGFAELFAHAGASWAPFYEQVRELAHMEPHARNAELTRLAEANRAVNGIVRAQRIACEALEF